MITVKFRVTIFFLLCKRKSHLTKHKSIAKLQIGNWFDESVDIAESVPEVCNLQPSELVQPEPVLSSPVL